jgi:hypothetical protein
MENIWDGSQMGVGKYSPKKIMKAVHPWVIRKKDVLE